MLMLIMLQYNNVNKDNCHVLSSLVSRLTWKSVGRTNPPGAGNFTLEPDNSIFFNGDHYKWVFFGIVHTRRGLWRWCHSLTFIGCPARTSFIPPRVCNLPATRLQLQITCAGTRISRIFLPYLRSCICFHVSAPSRHSEVYVNPV